LEFQVAKSLTKMKRTKHFEKSYKTENEGKYYDPKLTKPNSEHLKTTTAFPTGNHVATLRHEEPERTPTPAIKIGREVQYASLC